MRNPLAQSALPHNFGNDNCDTLLEELSKQSDPSNPMGLFIAPNEGFDEDEAAARIAEREVEARAKYAVHLGHFAQDEGPEASKKIDEFLEKGNRPEIYDGGIDAANFAA